MVVVPADRPDTVVEVPGEVNDTSPELVQLPEPAASLSTLVDPTHTLSVPVIAGGSAFTVTGAVTVVVHPPVPETV